MNKIDKSKKNLSEQEIDRIVTEQADNDDAWEKPVRVRRSKPISLPLPARLAARAAFLSQLHRAKNVEEWLTRVIQERIDLEEAAFMGIKKDLSLKNRP
ncbi:MAG: hypothetical protein AB1656_16470 [Candidatus Omnitrophota bacterium]